jgi:Co/Zn/Cd efflux system component
MSDHCCSIQAPSEDEPTLKKVLWIVFAINAGMFLIEFISGRLYHSAALMADSLDMLSDAIVYGVSILVLAKNNQIKAKVSLFKGVLMLGMALYVVYELVTKFFQPVLPADCLRSGAYGVCC